MQTNVLEQFFPREITDIIENFKKNAQAKDIIKSASLRFVVDTILKTFDSYGDAYLLLTDYNNHIALTGERGAPINSY